VQCDVPGVHGSKGVDTSYRLEPHSAAAGRQRAQVKSLVERLLRKMYRTERPQQSAEQGKD